jgi:hypothetical protein
VSCLPLWNRFEYKLDDVVMAQVESAGEERRVRRWRSVAEKRQISSTILGAQPLANACATDDKL